MIHDPRTQNMSNADSICWAFFLVFFFFFYSFFKIHAGKFPKSLNIDKIFSGEVFSKTLHFKNKINSCY